MRTYLPLTFESFFIYPHSTAGVFDPNTAPNRPQITSSNMRYPVAVAREYEEPSALTMEELRRQDEEELQRREKEELDLAMALSQSETEAVKVSSSSVNAELPTDSFPGQARSQQQQQHVGYRTPQPYALSFQPAGAKRPIEEKSVPTNPGSNGSGNGSRRKSYSGIGNTSTANKKNFFTPSTSNAANGPARPDERFDGPNDYPPRSSPFSQASPVASNHRVPSGGKSSVRTNATGNTGSAEHSPRQQQMHHPSVPSNAPQPSKRAPSIHSDTNNNTKPPRGGAVPMSMAAKNRRDREEKGVELEPGNHHLNLNGT